MVFIKIIEKTADNHKGACTTLESFLLILYGKSLYDSWTKVFETLVPVFQKEPAETDAGITITPYCSLFPEFASFLIQEAAGKRLRSKCG